MCVFQNERKFSAGSGERPADLRASTGRSANMAVSYTYKSVDKVYGISSGWFAARNICNEGCRKSCENFFHVNKSWFTGYARETDFGVD